MINWDIVMMLGQAFLTLFLLPTALAFDVSVKRTQVFLGLIVSRKKGVYVPRLTSGSTAIGLMVIVAALFGSGMPIGGATAAICVLLWGVVFVFRGKAPEPGSDTCGICGTQGKGREHSRAWEQNETSLEDLLQREGG